MSDVAGAAAPPTPSVLIDMCRRDDADLLPHDVDMVIIPTQAGGDTEHLPLQPVVFPQQAGGRVVLTIEQQLRNEIQSIHYTVEGTRLHAENFVEHRERHFRRSAAQYEEEARDVCNRELAENAAHMRADFQQVQNATVGQAEAAICDIRTQGMSYCEKKMDETRRHVGGEAETAFQVKQAEMQREYRQCEGRLNQALQRTAQAEGNLELEAN